MNQIYKNIEIIIIDDGSKDDSLKIAQAAAKKDYRIFIVSIDNQGVSHARNIGINQASGDYIFFLDADDYLDKNCLHELVKLTIKNPNTIYGVNVVRFTDSGTELRIDLSHPLIRRSNGDLLRQLFAGRTGCQVWGKLFPAYDIKKLKFIEELSHGEDLIFLLEYFLKYGLELETIKKAKYLYRFHLNSVTQIFSEETIRSNLKKIEFLKMLDTKRKYLKEIEEHLSRTLWILYRFMLKNPKLTGHDCLKGILFINKIQQEANLSCRFRIWNEKKFMKQGKNFIYYMLNIYGLRTITVQSCRLAYKFKRTLTKSVC